MIYISCGFVRKIGAYTAIYEYSYLILLISEAGDAYMRHTTGSSLVQVVRVACLVPSHYINKCMPHWEQSFVKLKLNSNIFVTKNTSEHVFCKMPPLHRGLNGLMRYLNTTALHSFKKKPHLTATSWSELLISSMLLRGARCKSRVMIRLLVPK